MRCSNCNSEWSIGQGGSQTLKCPFCGVMLNSLANTQVTMKDTVKRIIEVKGDNILYNKSRFSAMFSDLAPKLSDEKKIIDTALSPNVARLFLDNTIDHKQCYKMVQDELRKLMSDSAIDTFIEAIAYGLGWSFSDYSIIENNKKILNNNSVSATNNQINSSITATSNNSNLVGNNSAIVKKKSSVPVAAIICGVIGVVGVVGVIGSFNSSKNESFQYDNYEYTTTNNTTTAEPIVNNEIEKENEIISTTTTNVTTTETPTTTAATTAKTKDAMNNNYEMFETILVVHVDEADTLPLRNTTDKSDNIITRIPDGTYVNVLGYKEVGSEIWFRINYSDSKGWVRGGMLQPESIKDLNNDLFDIPALNKWKSKFVIEYPDDYNYFGSGSFKGSLYYLPDLSQVLMLIFMRQREIGIMLNFLDIKDGCIAAKFQCRG